MVASIVSVSNLESPFARQHEQFIGYNDSDQMSRINGNNLEFDLHNAYKGTNLYIIRLVVNVIGVSDPKTFGGVTGGTIGIRDGGIP